jgi:hypothetical protein
MFFVARTVLSANERAVHTGARKVPTMATSCCSTALMGEFQMRFLLSYLVCLAYMFIAYRLTPNVVKLTALQISG